MLSSSSSTQRLIYLSTAVLLTLFLAYLTLRQFRAPNPFLAHTVGTGRYDLSPEFLQPYVKDRPFRYARRYVKARHGSKPDESSLPKLSQSLNPTFSEITLADTSTDSPMQEDVLHLTVPELENKQKEEWPIVFGLATTVPRLQYSFPHMSHWLSRKGVSMVAVVEPTPEAALLQKEWRKGGYHITVIESRLTFNERLVSLLSHMYEHGKELWDSPRWYALADDDTFFPSIPRLRAHLAAYDDKRPFWIGALSEANDRVQHHGHIAFGGAGMFFSPALLEQLQPGVASCMDPQAEFGDLVISECIETHSRTRLTISRGLHQLDLFGDISGVYESGFKPLTLHHWEKARWKFADQDIPVAKVAQVSPITGEEGMFQRWRFADGWVLTNGFSLVKYGPALEMAEGDDLDFKLMEFTWNGPQKNFIQALGPFRRKLNPEEKTSWYFVDSMLEEGSVRQIYLRQYEDPAFIPEVIEMIWLKD